MFLSAASFAVSFQYTILSYLMQIRNLNFRFFLKFYSSNDEYLFSLYSDIFLSSASLPAFSPFHTSFRSSFSPFSFPFLFSSSFLRFHASFFPLPPVLLLFFSLFSFSPCIFSAFMLYLSGCVIFCSWEQLCLDLEQFSMWPESWPADVWACWQSSGPWHPGHKHVSIYRR